MNVRFYCDTLYNILILPSTFILSIKLIKMGNGAYFFYADNFVKC